MRTSLAPLTLAATLTLAAILSLPGMASADVYKCPAPGGTSVYQDAPCSADGEPAILSPGPGSQYRGPSLPLRPQTHAVPQATPPPEEKKTATGGPVDTHTFGMLEIGSSAARVLAKLGQPDHVVEDTRTFVPVRYSSGRVELREQRRSAWVYAGDNQTLKTVLTFENGQLVHKAKGR